MTFLTKSKLKPMSTSQERLWEMIEYLRQIALYRKTNSKSLSRKDKGRLTTEIHYMEKAILKRINFSEYLISNTKRK